MSDSVENDSSHSQSQLIEVRVNHVGVTAKLQSPLKNLLPQLSSSTDTEFFQKPKAQYNLFENEVMADTSITTTTAMSSPRGPLYEMHAEPEKHLPKLNRIEFQRYNKSKRPRLPVPPRTRPSKSKHSGSKSKTYDVKYKREQRVGFLDRIVASLDNMCKCQPQKAHSIIDDLPEPQWNKEAATRHTCIGIYPFEHGCADYLSTTDTHPKINAIVLADRATTYATHFWAEFFGLMHIGVAFVVAFVLQSYRFILYSLINTLIVGLLHMTSDYLIKPTLTVIFNGYLQPPMIFVYNIMCSLRDILEPLAETLHYFMRPLATLGGSIRLIHVNYRNVRRLAKDA
ncbi:CG3698 [Drosophila busckii]|uniref:CG3698 n=1 Tax=Drosophila busckii TaxID=30019 RepID=A0A0M4F1G7_DROBS|nr:CG3698 [Drosophila busckii]